MCLEVQPGPLIGTFPIAASQADGRPASAEEIFFSSRLTGLWLTTCLACA
jgi:hypothetical protein